MKRNVYITIVPEKITEGGMARNRAFFNFISDRKDIDVFNLKYVGILKRVFQVVYLSYILLKSRKKNIFIHETVLVSLFPLKLFKYHFFSSFFNTIIRSCDKNNLLFIEINDLPFEQAKDLELEYHSGQENFQKSIFSLKNAGFVFASHLMMKYAKDKYNLSNYCETIVNAGPKLDKNIYSDEPHIKKYLNPNKINLVYSGTLNKGRQIEKLIEIFSQNKSVQLFLLGSDGEWLEDEKTDNIFYLGNHDEKKAQCIVSLFDIGLVPYDNSRFYYNICYPTKVPFYLTAGLPVICTPLQEMEYWFSDKKYVIFEKIEEWNNLLLKINIDFLHHSKKTLNTEEYTWNHILENSGLNKFFNENSTSFSNL